MSEIFPDGTLERLGKALGPLEDYMDGGSPDGHPRPECVINAEVIIGQILADHATQTDGVNPYLKIAILKGYLQAVVDFRIGPGQTVIDLVKVQDHKLWFALQTAGVEV